MATINKQAIAATFNQTTTHYKQHTNLQHQNTNTLLTILPQHKYTHILNTNYKPN